MSRTVVNLRDDLIKEARRLTGLKTKVAIVNTALAWFVKHGAIRRAIMALEGRVRWGGDLKVMRRDRRIDFGG